MFLALSDDCPIHLSHDLQSCIDRCRDLVKFWEGKKYHLYVEYGSDIHPLNPGSKNNTIQRLWKLRDTSGQNPIAITVWNMVTD